MYVLSRPNPPGIVSGENKGRFGKLGIEEGSKVKSWSTTKVSRNSEKYRCSEGLNSCNEGSAPAIGGGDVGRLRKSWFEKRKSTLRDIGEEIQRQGTLM